MFRFPTKSSPLSRLIRQRKSYSGIATADRFLADVQSCLDGGMCPTRLLGKSDASWKKALKHSRNQLVYLDDDLTIKSESFDVLRAEIEKSLPPKSAGGFDHITTTTRRDRDRDVLETGGARVDAKGPLLLQHMPFELVGRLVSVLQHTKKALVERSAVAATAMSDDVMTLVEFGAFRISHGFRPFKWELIDPDDDRAGFHILEYEIMERSLVSVPSNVDAEILAHSRAKMATDFFRQFTKAKFDARPAMSPGASLPVVSKAACSCQKAHGTQVLRGDQAEEADPIRWNPSLSKEFDVAAEPLRPASLVIDWASRYLETPIKKIYKFSEDVPSVRMGGVLTGLGVAIDAEGLKTIDVRNIHGDSESPPEYETIDLNSEQSKSFLVEGFTFYKGSFRLMIDVERTWYGVRLTGYARDDEAIKALNVVGNAMQWAKDNPFLRGEAFALSGQFLKRTTEGWDDIFLEPENKTAIKNAIDRLNEKQAEFPNRGILLMGPPGTGKTLSGRIIRNTAKATYIWVSARDFYRSGGFGGMAMAFGLAKELAPCVLFFEDVDGHLSGETIDLLKTEMDGISRSAGVLTVLTTNHPERLPKAIIDRPGRFHDVLLVNHPTEQVRSQMIDRWSPGLDGAFREQIAKQTEGFSGAHLYELCFMAKQLSDTESMPMGEAIVASLDKIRKQRELIDDIQGIGYSPRKEIDDWMKMRKLCAIKSTTKEVADGTQGDAEEGAENAPNLRQSAEGEENCGTCQFFEEGQCTLHYFEVDSSMVCDDHEPREEGDMRSVEPEVKRVVAEKQSAAIAVANLLAQELVAGNAKSLADLEQVLLKGVEGIRERRSREADELLRSVLLG